MSQSRQQKFMQLVNENKRTIYKVCYMYASGEDHLKDLYQEVLANLWQGIDSFRGEAKASTWIYRTAINTCVTYYRRHDRHNNEMSSLDTIANLADAGDSGRSEQIAEMYRLIGQLNKMDKALILMWLDERSYDEIADVTGMTRNNVATRLRRIKQRLIEQGKEDR